MRKIFLLFSVFVLFYNTTKADFGIPNNGYSRSNVFGGTNFYENGRLVYSRPNVFGGQNYYRRGQLESFSRPNVFGGQVFRSWNGSKK